jgi:multidrug transporter EmrE-like cation transporter
MTAVLLRSMVMVFLAGIVGSVAAVFLKLGAARLTASIWSFVNRWVVGGIALYLVSSVIYNLALKGGQLSVLYPLVSLGYVWTIVWARLLFQEAFTGRKMAGLALILVGVALVGMGSG